MLVAALCWAAALLVLEASENMCGLCFPWDCKMWGGAARTLSVRFTDSVECCSLVGIEKCNLMVVLLSWTLDLLSSCSWWKLPSTCNHAVFQTMRRAGQPRLMRVGTAACQIRWRGHPQLTVLNIARMITLSPIRIRLSKVAVAAHSTVYLPWFLPAPVELIVCLKTSFYNYYTLITA